MKELLSDSAKRTLLGPGRQCTATNRDGDRCRRVPIVGGFVCTIHGGKAPLTIQAANQRKLLMVEPAFEVLDRAMRSGPPCEACGRSDADRDPTAVRAALGILDRAGHGPQASLLLGRAADPSPWVRWLSNEQLAQIAQWVQEAKDKMLEGEEPAPMTGLPAPLDAVVIEGDDSQDATPDTPAEGPVPTGNEP